MTRSSLIAQLWPGVMPEQTQKALAAFLTLWVSGTVGGFLAALMRAVPDDLTRRSWPADIPYTAALFLRYGYLLWFIIYFVLSNLPKANNRRVTWCDVAFDVLQTLVSFAAAFQLGFAVHGEGYSYERSASSFAFANLAILTICFVSVFLGGKSPITGLRVSGASLALFSLLALRAGSRGIVNVPTLWLLFASLLLLDLLLLAFGRLRISQMAIERLAVPDSARCSDRPTKQ